MSKSINLMRPSDANTRVHQSLKRRQKQEARFRSYGLLAIGTALLFLAVLFFSIFSKGIPGFFQHYVSLDLYVEQDRIDPSGDLSVESLYAGDARGIIRSALYEATGAKGRSEKRAAGKLISKGAEQRLRSMVLKDTSIVGKNIRISFAVDDDVDSFLRGYISAATPEEDRRLSNAQIKFIERLSAEEAITYELSHYLFFGSASRDAEIAGIKGAFVGSVLTLAVCLVLSFPMGVSTAIYLEEFAPKNRITEIIEVSINNLAAVPSVVFGILGLAVFIGMFGIPRSIPLVGGIVLALMTLPTIIISSRAAIRAVPPSIRDAALGIGASKLQTVTHHVLPLAMPGMLTGTIIGMAQALGETAPLLMIGMVAFIVDIPGGVTDPGTVLPVQIFMWADFAERMFVHKTSAAIIVLLAFLFLMNASAILIRRKLERRW